MPTTPREGEKEDRCLLKRALKGLLRKHPRGMTLEAICRHLLNDGGYSGSYRNLTFQTHSILGILIEEGKVVCSGNGGGRVYIYRG